MSLVTLVALVVCVALIIWAVPRLPAPWRYVAVAVILVVALWLLMNLIGGGAELGAIDAN